MNKEQAKQMLLNVINNLQLTHKDREVLWLAISVLENNDQFDNKILKDN